MDEKENLREFNKLAGDEEQYLKEKQIALDNNNLGGPLFVVLELVFAASKIEKTSF